MEAPIPAEKKLRDIYWGQKTNSTSDRLEIANIFKKSNFMYGKESK